MLLITSSVVYQIFHPWHWLTYGQNSSAVASVATVVAAAAAIVAGIFAVRTYRSTIQALRITEAAALAEKNRFTEIYSPHISIQCFWPVDSMGNLRIQLRNIGRGRAIKIIGKGLVECYCLGLVEGATHLAAITLGIEEWGPKDHLNQLTLSYASADGREFDTIFFLLPGVAEPVQSVIQSN